MKKNVTIKISGKVQGVFFRASTKDKADELGLKGWVQNERDGSVLTEAEGEEGAVNAFIAWCHEGPRFARVDQCEVTAGDLKNFSDFVIKR